MSNNKRFQTFEEILNENKKIIIESKSYELIDDDVELRNSIARDRQEIAERNKLYTALLSDYVNNYGIRHKNNRYYKFWFFLSIMLVFIITILGSISIFILLAIYGTGGYEEIALAISSLATIISSLIVIPKIIAEYLFPPDEDNKVTDMVKTMQQNDCKTRKINSSN